MAGWPRRSREKLVAMWIARVRVQSVLVLAPFDISIYPLPLSSLISPRTPYAAVSPHWDRKARRRLGRRRLSCNDHAFGGGELDGVATGIRSWARALSSRFNYSSIVQTELLCIHRSHLTPSVLKTLPSTRCDLDEHGVDCV